MLIMQIVFHLWPVTHASYDQANYEYIYRENFDEKKNHNYVLLHIYNILFKYFLTLGSNDFKKG